MEYAVCSSLERFFSQQEALSRNACTACTLENSQARVFQRSIQEPHFDRPPPANTTRGHPATSKRHHFQTALRSPGGGPHSESLCPLNSCTAANGLRSQSAAFVLVFASFDMHDCSCIYLLLVLKVVLGLFGATRYMEEALATGADTMF